MKREFVYGLIIALVVVVGVVAVYEISKRKAASVKEEKDVSATVPQDTKPQLRVTHSFFNGEHTYRGTVQVPTPCFTVSASSQSSGDNADSAEFDIAVAQDATQTACAQVITSKDFLVRFKAAQSAVVSAKVNGQEVELLTEEATSNYFDGSKDGFTLSYPLTWNEKDKSGDFTDVVFQDTNATSTLEVYVDPSFSPTKVLGLSGLKKDKIQVGSLTADYAVAGKTSRGAFIRVNNLTQGGRYYTLEYNTSKEPADADAEFKTLLSGFQLTDAGELYMNTADYFSLVLPSSWTGYKVTKQGSKDAPSYLFTKSEGNTVTMAFSVDIYTKDGWKAHTGAASEAQQGAEQVLAQGQTKVFVANLAPTTDGKLVAASNPPSSSDIQALGSSFKILPAKK